MFEATLQKASTLKKVIEAIKDLVTDGNIEVSETGMNLQAMDSSHVSLVSLVLHTDMFEHFRCDRNVTLGINLPNFAKILKCSGNDDSVTLKAQDDGENLAIVFESEGQERVGRGVFPRRASGGAVCLGGRRGERSASAGVASSALSFER